MADMANAASTNSFVYDRLSFPGYYSDRPCLDTEWLLSTLFDASLLSTSKAAGNGGSFFAVIPGRAPSREPGIRQSYAALDFRVRSPLARAPE
jgi:hypothetical protein